MVVSLKYWYSNQSSKDIKQGGKTQCEALYQKS